MKKYSGVYQPLIARLTQEGANNSKAVKTKLHQVYGAYTQENGYKKATKILDELIKEERIPGHVHSDIHEVSKMLLGLHTSTKERLPFYDEFYGFILENTGPIKSVLDIGCGYNPFSVPLIQIKLEAYFAVDIDVRVANLINHFFVILGLPPYAKCADLAVEIPKESADIALVCKLLPVLEAQSSGSGFSLLRQLNTKYLLITYPLKSLGGREKGMAKNYSATFEKAVNEGQLAPFTLINQKQVGHEMLYLASK